VSNTKENSLIVVFAALTYALINSLLVSLDVFSTHTATAGTTPNGVVNEIGPPDVTPLFNAINPLCNAIL